MGFYFILLGINIILLCVMFLFLKRRIDNSFKSTELLNQIETELDRVIAELNQTTDRNINLIEDRIDKLNRLLEEADRRMVLFAKEQEKLAKTGAGVYTKPMPLKLRRVDENPGGPLPGEPAASGASPTGGVFPGTAGTARAVGAAGASGAAGTAGVYGASGISAAPEPEVLSSREKVLKLDYQGLSAQEIASRLGRSLGEVELILSLHRESRKGKDHG